MVLFLLVVLVVVLVLVLVPVLLVKRVAKNDGGATRAGREGVGVKLNENPTPVATAPCETAGEKEEDASKDDGEGLAPRESVAVGVHVPVCVGDCVPDGVALEVVLGENEVLAVLDGDAPCVKEDVGERDSVLEADSMVDGVAAGVIVDDPVGVPVSVAVAVKDAVVLRVCETLAVFEGEAPGLKEGVGSAETVLLAEAVVEGVTAPVPVPLTLAVAVGVPVEEGGGVTELVKEGLPLPEDEAPMVRDGVGEAEPVLLKEIVVLGVKVAVPVLEGVDVAVEEGVVVGGGVVVPESELLPVLEGVAPIVSEGVGEEDTVELPESMVLGVKDPVPVAEEVGVAVGVGLVLGEGVARLESEALPVLEGEAPLVSKALCDAVAVELVEIVVLAVIEAVPVLEAVGDAVDVGLGVGGGVPVLEKEALPVFEGEEPLVRDAVGVADTVELPESVVDGVGAPVPVPLPVDVPVAVPVEVIDGVALLEKDVLAVLLAEAPTVREAVGDADRVELAESVVLGVESAVPVPEPVGVGVGVCVGVGGAVALLEKEVLAVLLAETPSERAAVGVADSVLLEDTVVLCVAAAVPVFVCVGEPVDESEGVEGGVALPESDMLGVLLEDAPVVRDGVGEPDTVLLAEAVVEGVKDPVPVPVPLGVPVGDAVGKGGGVLVLEKRELLPVVLADTPTVRVPVGEADTVGGVTDGVALKNDVVPVVEPVGVDETVWEKFGVKDGIPVPVSEVLPEFEEDKAPIEIDVVGVADTVGLAESSGGSGVVAPLAEGGGGSSVAEGEAVPTPDTRDIVAAALAATKPVTEPEGVQVLDKELLGELLELAPPDKDAVGEEDVVVLPEMVLEGEPVEEGDGVAEGDSVAVEEPESVRVDDEEGVTGGVLRGVPVGVREGVLVGVALDDAPADTEEVGVDVGLAVSVLVEEEVALRLVVLVGALVVVPPPPPAEEGVKACVPAVVLECVER